jgi:hypothetical protein
MIVFIVNIDGFAQWPTDTKEIIRILKSKKTDNTMAKRYQRDNQNM